MLGGAVGTWEPGWGKDELLLLLRAAAGGHARALRRARAARCCRRLPRSARAGAAEARHPHAKTSRRALPAARRGGMNDAAERTRPPPDGDEAEARIASPRFVCFVFILSELFDRLAPRVCAARQRTCQHPRPERGSVDLCFSTQSIFALVGSGMRRDTLRWYSLYAAHTPKPERHRSGVSERCMRCKTDVWEQ
jgi:hypothetical protein